MPLLLRAGRKYITNQPVWEAAHKSIESWNYSADKKAMEFSPPLVLCFVFAIVVGYFAGRMIGILNRNDRRPD